MYKLTFGLLFVCLASTAVAQPATFDPPLYVSYYGNRKCSSIVAQGAGVSESAIFSSNYVCDSLQVPTAWQKTVDNETEYDLVIVGAGIGGAYLVNRIYEEYERVGQAPPKIALAERTNWLGGRLMSALGTGALGLAVQSKTAQEAGIPPQEYGGMRVDPYRYPLLFRMILKYGKAIYGDDKCLDITACLGGENCCPEVLARMEVGSIRYASTRKDVGIIANSTIDTPSKTYEAAFGNNTLGYSNAQIAEGVGSPYDNCAQLIFSAKEYYNSSGNDNISWKDAVNGFCDDCSNGVNGSCELCAKFPGDSKVKAGVSCTGYDMDTNTVSLNNLYGLASEVLNLSLSTRLYLIKDSFQRLAQGLLYRQGSTDVSPLYNKQLTSVSLGSGKDPQELSQQQINAIGPEPQVAQVPEPETVILGFGDGSSVRAKSAYLTMLPFDLPQVDGFQPWRGELLNVTTPGQAVKLVLGWENPNEAPAAVLNFSPCVSEQGCQRMILDGPANENWMVRQVWFWDNRTIMIYNIAPGEPTDQPYAATNMMGAASTKGMNAMVQTVMDQIRAATGKAIVDPDWARLKPWPSGNLLIGWGSDSLRNASGESVASYLERPLGPSVPVFYGNSEASKNGLNHGWVEGSLEMVEDSLPSLLKHLGYKGEVQNLLHSDATPQGSNNMQQASGKLASSQSRASSVGIPLALIMLTSYMSNVIL